MTIAPPPASSTPPAAERHWTQSWPLGLATIAILFLVTGMQWWQAWTSNARLREETLAQAELRAAQVTSAATELVDLLLRTVDATSADLANVYVTRPLKEFEAAMAQELRQLPNGAVLQVAVIGVDGYLAYSNLGMAERPFLGDREHFKVHLESEEDRLFISRPVLGRVSKQWSIQFSRPMRRNGRLVGVMVMSLSPTYLHNAMGRVALASADTLAVLRRSGEYLARNKDQEASLGKKFVEDSPLSQPGLPTTGTFVTRSPIDGVERIFQWQSLDDQPVIVLLGLSRTAVLAPVERVIEETNRRALASILVLWAATGLVAWMVRRVRTQVLRRQEAEYLAMHDTLTGLHSRHALMTYLAQVLGGEGRVGVLYMDLDGFKQINDSQGHAIGDQVLQAVAGRLKGCVRGNDLPARIGGDEFVVVVAPLGDERALARLAERIQEALMQPMRISGTSLRVGASIGLAIGPDDGRDADALLTHADREMYAQKQAHKQAHKAAASVTAAAATSPATASASPESASPA